VRDGASKEKAAHRRLNIMARYSLYTRTAALLVLIVLGGAISSLSAQSVNVFFGMGSAHDSASPAPFVVTDPFGAFVSNQPRSSLGGVFGNFGAEFMLTPHMGFGGEYAFRFAQGDYVKGTGNNDGLLGSGIPIKDRPGFYDFNFIYQPTKEGKIVPEFQGGLGGARVSYYANAPSCSQLSGCTNYNVLVDQGNHFQLHFGAGIRVHLTDNIFVRPQFDLHWVHGFTDPNVPVYGSDWVPQYTIAIGYSFGAH
jgi:hypothetical protein